MIFFVIGKLGTGKSVYVSRLTKNVRRVFFDRFREHTPLIETFPELLTFARREKNVCIIVEEVSYFTLPEKQEVLALLRESRHKGIDYVLTTQRYTDTSMRDYTYLCDYLVICGNILEPSDRDFLEKFTGNKIEFINIPGNKLLIREFNARTCELKPFYFSLP